MSAFFNVPIFSISNLESGSRSKYIGISLDTRLRLFGSSALGGDVSYICNFRCVGSKVTRVPIGGTPDPLPAAGRGVSIVTDAPENGDALGLHVGGFFSKH